MIILGKSDKPLTHLDLCKKLDIAWNSLDSWIVIPFGKRFYEFAFDSLEEGEECLLRVLESQFGDFESFCLD